jgi:hypothetical protein
MKNKQEIIWAYNPGNKNQAPLYHFGDYVISERSYYTLSYRPPGQHIPLGQFENLNLAKEVAIAHYNRYDRQPRHI